MHGNKKNGANREAKTEQNTVKTRPAIESQAKIPTKRKIILRNFKCEKRA